MVPSPSRDAVPCQCSRSRLCSRSWQFNFPPTSPRSFVSRKGHHLRAYCLTGISLAPSLPLSQLMTLYLHIPCPSHHQASSDINFVPLPLATPGDGRSPTINCLGPQTYRHIIHAVRAVPDGCTYLIVDCSSSPVNVRSAPTYGIDARSALMTFNVTQWTNPHGV
jgi:hypothetical protein